MTISVALIVKDEERTLGRCLASLRSGVDEIVVVDTGSRDATRAIAARFTDRVFEFPWREDFAAARQFAFDRATGDWVTWVDADDVVVNAEHIRSDLANAGAEVGAVYWRYVVDRDQWGNSRCEFWRERCVRNDGNYRWSGRIHEVLVPRRPCATLRSTRVTVEHRPDPDRRGDKIQRNLGILEAEYAAAGTSASPRLLLYLAREHASAGNTRRALTLLQNYLQVAGWDEERYLAQTQIADLYRAESRYDLAINAGLQALKICPHWPDAYFGLAKTYYFLQDWHRVIHWTEIGRAMPAPDTIQIINPLEYRYGWIIYYTNALFRVGAIREAQEWTRRALEICPDAPWHRENYLACARALQETERAPWNRPAETAPRGQIRPEPLRVVWEGPQFVHASFGVVNREVCSTLLAMTGEREANPDVDGRPLELTLQPLPPAEFGPDEAPERFGDLAARFHAPLSGPADVHVSLTYREQPEPPPAGRWVVFQPWDYTGMPRRWLDLFQNHVDEVWVPSRFVWQCYVENGVPAEKVHIIPLGVCPDTFHPGLEPLPLSTRKSFRFLFVGGTLWRKGIDVLLNAYTRAFDRGDDVCLVIKDVGAHSYYRAHNARERIVRLRDDPAAPEIVYLAEDMPEPDIARLYSACNCLAHPYRGEGFALPVAEAMACGLPVIVTRGGPSDDYCTDETAYRIPADLVPCAFWEETVNPAHVLEPDPAALSGLLRHAFEHRDEAAEKGARAAAAVHAHLTWQHTARAVLERLTRVGAIQPDVVGRAAPAPVGGEQRRIMVPDAVGAL